MGRIAGQRLHNGLPVIPAEEFDQGYSTRSTDETQAIFNFRGYVEKPDGELVFRDAAALNGLRGVHVGIDGTASYDEGGYGLKGPEDVGEFVVYIKIPSAVQRAEGVVCLNDTCKSVAAYREKESRYDDQETITEDIRRRQEIDGYAVIRLTIDPRSEGGRDAVGVLALAISEYLKSGQPLEGLESFIYDAEQALISGKPMAGRSAAER